MIRDRLAATGKRFYCLCFTVRSGSSLLCEDLAQWHAGEPTEYFQLTNPVMADTDMPDHLVAHAEAARDDYFGFKISWEQAYQLTERLRIDGEESVSFDLRTVFPDLLYIHITRRDKVRQAVSAWRAEHTGAWHWPVGSALELAQPEYDFAAIRRHLQKALAEDWLWRSHFQDAGIQPFVLAYEDYEQDREGHLVRIAEFLGVAGERPGLQDRLRVMRDDWTEGMVARFRADLYSAPEPISAPGVRVVATYPAETPLPAGGPPPAEPDGRGAPRAWQNVPPIAAPVAFAVGVSAVDAALPQVTLAPLLITAPILAGALVSARRVAWVTLLCAALVFPLAVSDKLSDMWQAWLITGIAVAGVLAIWISRHRTARSGR